MTKKHFEAIAKAIAANTYLTEQSKLSVAECLADEFCVHNARFDRARFIAAATQTQVQR